MKFIKHMYIGIILLFFSAPLVAQEEDILGHIESPGNYTTFELAHMDKNLTTFMNLLSLSGLETSLLFAEEHTLIIPTNESFKEMTIAEFKELTDPKNKTKLIAFIKDHNIPSKVMKYELTSNHIISKYANDKIRIKRENDEVYIGGAKIIVPDIEASNGVIQIVDNTVYAIN